ncbi:putative RNA methylase involved in rRNA processing [Pseudoloma neurophilia]|uniref:Ribosomal RNA-processing protein 8 n=1 Tax=Pseudoloma neurophilia TaxID=146866 RepID=A0A0R0M158_9MICR|nr:putative RNA methylase involved in rRNA processing [Pseudoloma neurophilia]
MTLEDLHKQYKSRLRVATFRILNNKFDDELSHEQLIDYHLGYDEQMKRWPEKPIEVLSSYLTGSKKFKQNDSSDEEFIKNDKNFKNNKRFKTESKSISENYKPLKISKNTKIADIGCGTCKLSENVLNFYKKSQIEGFDEKKLESKKNNQTPKFFNYDIHPVNDSIIKAQSNKIPVKDSYFDIAVYCLSLMAENLTSDIKEAHRIIKPSGNLLIAELTSRISPYQFIKHLESYNFKLNKIILSNDFFFVIDLIKIETNEEMKPEKIVLKPAVYKKR